MKTLVFSTDWLDGLDDATIWNCDFRDGIAANIDRGTTVTVTGSLGLWDGRHAVKAKEDNLWDAVRKCISGCDVFEVWQTGKYTLEIAASHHDGTNRFKLTQYQ